MSQAVKRGWSLLTGKMRKSVPAEGTACTKIPRPGDLLKTRQLPGRAGARVGAVGRVQGSVGSSPSAQRGPRERLLSVVSHTPNACTYCSFCWNATRPRPSSPPPRPDPSNTQPHAQRFSSPLPRCESRSKAVLGPAQNTHAQKAHWRGFPGEVIPQLGFRGKKGPGGTRAEGVRSLRSSPALPLSAPL